MHTIIIVDKQTSRIEYKETGKQADNNINRHANKQTTMIVEKHTSSVQF